MLTIHRSRLPAAEADVRAALLEYQGALAHHSQSEGVPAPWPAFELLRDIVAAGGQFAVIDDAPGEPAALTAEMRLEILERAVQDRLDIEARRRGYDSIFTAVTYADEPAVPKFQAEGQRLRAWRSLVWASCTRILAAVKAGDRAEPSVEQLLAELPTIYWND